MEQHGDHTMSEDTAAQILSNALRTGVPFVVLEQHTRLLWSGHPRNFRCRLCGHTFRAGETARWLYTNSSKIPGVHGNPFICEACDGTYDDIITRLVAMREQFQAIQTKYWWFMRETTP